MKSVLIIIGPVIRNHSCRNDIVTMAAKEAPVQMLHRHLGRKTCLCSVFDTRGLERMASFAHWIHSLADKEWSENLPRANEQNITKAAPEKSVPKDDTNDKGIEEGAILNRTSLASPTDRISYETRNQSQDSKRCQINVDNEHQPEAGLKTVQPSTATQTVVIKHPQKNTTGSDEQCRDFEKVDKTIHKAGGEWIVDGEEPRLDGCRQAALVCLTVGQELFEARHCERLHHLQTEMTSRGSLLEELSRLMASEDRLVAFMASKMTRTVLLSAVPDKDKCAVFFQHNLQRSVASIKAFMPVVGREHQGDLGQATLQADREDTSGHNTTEFKSADLTSGDVSAGQVNHAIFTFDLCRLLLKTFGDGASQDKKEHEGTEGSPTCRSNSYLLTSEERCGRLQDLQKGLTHLLYGDLPDMLRAFAHPISQRLTTMDSHGHTLLLASLLDLVSTLLKHGKHDRQQTHFTANLTAPLLSLLPEMLTDLIVFKKLLDIFVSLTSQSETTRPHPSQSDPTHHRHADEVVAMATTFFHLIVEGSLFESIPYESGPMGFGGSHFRSCGLDEELEFGDRTLLRKLCRATFSTMQILFCEENSESNLTEADAEKCLEILSRYVSRKLDLDVSSDLPTWLFKLFADQDDSLVWAMHCCLSLHRAAERRHPHRHPRATLERHLNPHRIFSGFLETVSHDPSLLLDLLISAETSFLRYFVQYLHTVLDDWDMFCSSHQSMDSGSHTRPPTGVLDEVSSGDELSGEDDGNVASGSDSAEDKPYLEQQEAAGENSPMSKRRKLKRNSNLECRTSHELDCDNVLIQATVPSPVDESDEGFLAAACIGRSATVKSTMASNKSSPDLSGDSATRSSETFSTRRWGTETEVDVDLQESGLCGTSSGVPTDTHPDKPDECPSGRIIDACENSASNDVTPAENAEVLKGQTAVPRSLEDVMTTLIRLRFLVERISGKNLFPYPARPLLRLLGRAEALYEEMG